MKTLIILSNISAFVTGSSKSAKLSEGGNFSSVCIHAIHATYNLLSSVSKPISIITTNRRQDLITIIWVFCFILALCNFEFKCSNSLLDNITVVITEVKSSLCTLMGGIPPQTVAFSPKRRRNCVLCHDPDF